MVSSRMASVANSSIVGSFMPALTSSHAVHPNFEILNSKFEFRALREILRFGCDFAALGTRHSKQTCCHLNSYKAFKPGLENSCRALRVSRISELNLATIE